MSDAGETAAAGVGALGKKLGPLPVWGWGLIAGALGVGVYLWQSRKNTTNTDGVATVQAGNPVTGEAGYSSATDTSSYVTDGLAPAASGDSTTTNDTNNAWLARAVSAVASSTGQSATLITAALQTWLQGGTVTSQQQAWIDKAQSLQGLPPEGLSGTTTVVANPAAPATATATAGYTSFGKKANDLYVTYLHRSLTPTVANASVAARMFADGRSEAQVIAWIKTKDEYKQLQKKAKS